MSVLLKAFLRVPSRLAAIKTGTLVFLLLVGGLIAARPATSQVMDAFFLNELEFGQGSNGLDRFTSIVHLRPSVTTKVGTSTFMFTYNASGLTFPSGRSGNQPLQRGVDYDMLSPFDSLGSGGHYKYSTVTLFGDANRISINLVLDSTAQGGLVSSSGTSVAKFYFDVLSDVETSQLVWVQTPVPNSTFFQLDDNVVNIPSGALADRDDLLDVQLPVELTRFEGRAQAQRAIIGWSTTREINLAAFEVQLFSREHQDWVTHTIVEPSPRESDSDGAKAYVYETQSLDFGEHRFRLRAFSIDGVETFSNEAVVEIVLSEPYQLGMVYPNPVSTRATLPLAVREPQRVSIKVVDLLGREVGSLFDEQLVENETHRIGLSLDGLASGTYYLVIHGDAIRETRSLVVVQ